ncbi:15717_t:CDS:2, partial [Acaulospora colombiana]
LPSLEPHSTAQKDPSLRVQAYSALNRCLVRENCSVPNFWALDYGSPLIFLQVCQGWHALAQSSKILWTKIYCGDYWAQDEMLSYVKCPTPEALQKHLSRIDGVKFELYLYKYLRYTEAEKWASILRTSLQNCHKICSKLNAEHLDPDFYSFVGLGSNRLIDQLLEEISRLSGDPEGPGTYLRTLVYTWRFPPELYGLSAIWNQLHVLYLEGSRFSWDEGAQFFFSSLHNLRELLLDGIGTAFSPGGKALRLGKVPGLNMDIVELSYTTQAHGELVDCDKVLTLPNLRRLSVMVYWPLILSIDAPNIEEVEMRGGRLVDVHIFTQMTLKPQLLYLHIDQHTEQALFERALDRLSILTLVDLRLEQDNVPKVGTGLMQGVLENVKRGISVRWNGVQVTGSLEQIATWAKSGQLNVEC